MPMLAETLKRRPATANGSASTAGDPLGDRDRFRATVHAVEQHRELVATEPGEHVGPRMILMIRRAASTRTMSPTAWPSESLMTLNRSMSRYSTPIVVWSRRAAATAASSAP